ncbi:hypothetical protein MJO28_015909 [Puccinia striiformis f. sp. tritici]|uniref:Uncharacterized protein n=3 Tax=Puccinia striiformis TaxID=27350 RepID=A0A2S4VHM2_9BASI|nr:hypothetical protein MJO28_015909 [Puccinia striiformis f. sp. tritici]POW05301.1 hypothetical protein PSTT_09789 [Puccinia striiformis]POW08965.1 hypothetical protein PSHT_09349 [Puccinia striiformis]
MSYLVKFCHVERALISHVEFVTDLNHIVTCDAARITADAQVEWKNLYVAQADMDAPLASAQIWPKILDCNMAVGEYPSTG